MAHTGSRHPIFAKFYAASANAMEREIGPARTAR